ncbi:hypothetical protein C8Q76DRAFT_754286 [Earliella scabrosa]|nr:hypothetical protein C8Q76DRAFT_754286 [Earliella scabrosa]
MCPRTSAQREQHEHAFGRCRREGRMKVRGLWSCLCQWAHEPRNHHTTFIHVRASPQRLEDIRRRTPSNRCRGVRSCWHLSPR